MRLNSIRKICSIIAGMALMAVVALTQQSCSGDEVQGKLDKLATEMNSSLPMALDSTMRLDKVAATEGRTFEYHYTVLKPTDNEALKKQLTEQYVERAKSVDMEAFRKDGVKLVYSYKDESGKQLFDIKLNTADYK